MYSYICRLLNYLLNTTASLATLSTQHRSTAILQTVFGMKAFSLIDATQMVNTRFAAKDEIARSISSLVDSDFSDDVVVLPLTERIDFLTKAKFRCIFPDLLIKLFNHLI